MPHFKEQLDIKDMKDIQMLYHTSLRNVGLFTSISLAMLGYSRYYRDKNIVYNVSFIVISMGFLFLATYMDYMLVRNQRKFMHKMNGKKKQYMIELTSVPLYVLYLNSVVMIFSIYSLYRELSAK